MTPANSKIQMIKYFFATLCFCGFVQLTCEANAAFVDSVGTVVRNGKTFTIHKVAPKETIYALSRQYKVSVSQIQQANPGVSALAVGQTVFVPAQPANVTTGNSAEVATSSPATTSPAAPANAPASSTAAVGNTSGKKVHTVEPKQTLYAVARLYNVSTADLKNWNNLTSDNLKEGQTLYVAAPSEVRSQPSLAPASTAPVTAPVTEERAEASVATPIAAPVKPVARKEEIKRETAPVKEERTETRYTETMSRVSESGLAEVMDQKEEGKKYLALHKTAPIGTILQVRNTLNNQSVYVRVSGKLPEGTANDNVIIKVSKRAYQKLAATDNKFRVEVNYMP